MVYHMIPEDVARSYPAQWRHSLKPDGLLFITDHNPMDGGTTGPRRPIMKLFGLIGFMSVVPQETEVAEIVAGGFKVLDGPYDHPFYMGGYAATYVPATKDDDDDAGETEPPSNASQEVTLADLGVDL